MNQQTDFPDTDFDITWRDLSEKGMVDGWGGSQYEQAHEEWEKAGEPDDIEMFILSP